VQPAGLGHRPRGLRAFAAEAIAAGEGSFLDAGCATATFTATAYRAASRPLLRAPAVPVQADLLDLPFSPRRFATVACFGVLHVLDDPWAALAALAALCEQTAPGGRIFASMLVADRRPGRDVRCWTLIGLLRPAA